MRRALILCFVAAFLPACGDSGSSSSGAIETLWSLKNPTNVKVASMGATLYVAVSDGSGGVIVVWEDNRTLNLDVYAQRISAAGVPLWTVDGVPVANATHDERMPHAVADGAGGVIVSWDDARNGTNFDIYAQRLNGNGQQLWTAGGVAVCVATNDQLSARLVSDGGGGAIFAWSDPRGANADVYAQRLNANGQPQWTADGVALCAAAGGQGGARLVPDGADGAIIVWTDSRLGFNSDIYAQRINAAGAPQWTADGVAVCSAVNPQMRPRPIPDGNGGMIVVWEDNRTGLEDVFAQKLDASGTPQWTTDGVPISVSPGYQYTPRVVTDGAGGAIIAWHDENGGPTANILAQRVNAAGVPQWTINGLSIATATGYQRFPDIVSDGAGGAVIGWDDNRSGSFDICAQHVDASGALLWSPNPTIVSSAPNHQQNVAMVPNGFGGAVFVWLDYRPGMGDSDIYAQGLSSTGQ